MIVIKINLINDNFNLIGKKMKKKIKRVYVAPLCTVYPMQCEAFLKTSVQPKVPGSTEEEWEEEEEIDAGVTRQN